MGGCRERARVRAVRPVEPRQPWSFCRERPPVAARRSSGGRPAVLGERRIYAIYLVDATKAPSDLYGRLAGKPAPIYVGRAVPEGARKGLVTDDLAARSRALWGRLDEHRTSIEQAADLDVDGFGCRWLVADQLFVPMAESLMIATYHPVWNVAIDGFGNHDPGAGRYKGERMKWDTLHPGRPWATRLAEPSVSAADLRGLIAGHFETYPPEHAPTVPPLTTEVPVVEAVAPDEARDELDQVDAP